VVFFFRNLSKELRLDSTPSIVCVFLHGLVAIEQYVSIFITRWRDLLPLVAIRLTHWKTRHLAVIMWESYFTF
jgi:hypothetical protein